MLTGEKGALEEKGRNGKSGAMNESRFRPTEFRSRLGFPRRVYSSCTGPHCSNYGEFFYTMTMGNIEKPEPTPFRLTALDRQLLAMTDEEFVAHDWDNLRDIIGEILSPHLLTTLPSRPQPGMIWPLSSASPPICADTWPGPRIPKPSMAPS